MKIIVIGGHGRIGSKIVERLGEHGHEAVAADLDGGAVAAGLDPQHQVAVGQVGVADHAPAGPELGSAVCGLFGADDGDVDLMHGGSVSL